MSVRPTMAVLTISVDLERAAAGLGLADERASGAITDRLLEMFAARQIPATWSVAEPATSAASQRIVARRGDHEIALWGNASWTGHTASRAGFSRELARHAAAGQASGVAISTLVIEGTLGDEHAEPAIRHGITAVRHAVDGAERARPRTLRFGLWSFPVEQTLPGTSRWRLGGGGGRAIRAGVDRIVVAGGLMQLVIDAQRLAARGYTAQRVLDRVLAHAEWRRRQGVLDVATLGATAARLSAQTPSVPSRSILRAA